MPRPTRSVAGVQVEKARLQPQGSKEHRDLNLVGLSVDLTESFPQVRPSDGLRSINFRSPSVQHP
jgi:hypothetical protein